LSDAPNNIIFNKKYIPAKMRAREISLYSKPPTIQNLKNVAFVPLALKGIFSVHVVYVS